MPLSSKITPNSIFRLPSVEAGRARIHKAGMTACASGLPQYTKGMQARHVQEDEDGTGRRD
jgi:hypothetical protein